LIARDEPRVMMLLPCGVAQDGSDDGVSVSEGTQRLCPAGPTALYPMSFTITQPPRSFTELTAVINNANVILNARGTVSSEGRLMLADDTEYSCRIRSRADCRQFATRC
jgi:hypothetical protein